MRRLRGCSLAALLLAGAFGNSGGAVNAQPSKGETPPNIVLLFADDLGYADLGVYGSATIRTPTLDRLAMEGQKWTNFYAAASVCSPSRAALMTGRLPIRTGVGPDHPLRRVFFPNSSGGLPQNEQTIAEVLKPRGYATVAIGKWHLGHLPEFLPTSQGFDSYFGIPYSNDMDAPGGIEVPWSVELFHEEADIAYWDVPLMEGERVLERPANQWTLTQRYTERAVEFIERSRSRPFFLYLAYSHPHTPVFASKEFWGKSPRGHYGDTVEEIDWSVRRIVETLTELKLDRNTLVVFTSDNGPWLTMRQLGGSAGMLRDGKGTTWEGGMRVPAIFWWPGRIQPQVVTGVGSTLDLTPTFASLARADLAKDRVYDSVDQSPTLLQGAPSARDVVFFYRLQDVYAVRMGPYKAHFVTESSFGEGTQRTEHDPPLLFNVDEDPSESFDISARHPDVLEKIRALVREHRATIQPVENQLNRYPPGEKRGEEGLRPWGK